jgi:hypothetical protein
MRRSLKVKFNLEMIRGYTNQLRKKSQRKQNKHTQLVINNKVAVMIGNTFFFCKKYVTMRIRRSSCISDKGIKHKIINFKTVFNEKLDLVNA